MPPSLKAIRLFVLLCLCLPGTWATRAQSAHAQTAPTTQTLTVADTIGARRVSKVEVIGAKSVTPERLIPRLRVQAGQPFNRLDTREDLVYLARNFFSASVDSIEQSDGTVLVRYLVTEFPKLNQWSVVGNKKLSNKRLDYIFRDLDTGIDLTSTVIRQLRTSLTNEYKNLGLPQTRIQIQTLQLPAGDDGLPRADLQITLDEGEQIICRDVILRGHDSFSTFRLKQVMDLEGSWYFIKNYFDDEVLENDLTRLRDFYNGNGYFDVVVRRGLFQQTTDKKGRLVVSPVIEIEEGRRYEIGDVTVQQARYFSTAEVQQPFGDLKGKSFDARDFDRGLAKLKSLYYSHGLITTEFGTDFDFDREAAKVDTTITVDEHERIYVSKIKLARPIYDEDAERSWFAGMYDRIAPPVQDEVVMRELLLEPGDIYNKDLEEQSLRRLQRLGVFTPESLRIVNEPTAEPGLHNMVVQGEEAVTGSLSGGVGFNDTAGVFIFAAYNERNIGGRADTLTVRGTLGSNASSAAIVYQDRHLGDTLNSLTGQIYYQTLRRPGYIANKYGNQFDLMHPLGIDWQAHLLSRLEYVDLDHRAGYGDARVDLDRDYVVATTGLRFEQDTRQPLGRIHNRGFSQEFGVESGWAGDFFMNLSARRDQYIPITENITFRMDARGEIMPYDRDRTPIEERLYLGGTNDLRGFAYRRVGDFDENENYVPLGGTTKFLLRNELSRPIVGPIHALLFTDIGVLGEDPFDMGRARGSAGLGFRFDLSSVFVEFGVALPYMKDNDDETRIFHFSVQGEI